MKEKKRNQKKTAFQTFTVPIPFKENKEQTSITSNSASKTYKDKILNQALKYHSEGNIIEAAKYYLNLIEQGSKNPGVFYNYGIILKSIGKLKEAETSYRRAIEIDPGFANAHYNLGNVLRDLGNLQEAELSTRKAIELKPDFAEANANLGNILSNIGKFAEAESYYRKAIELNPNLAKVYYSLSLLKYSNDNKIWQNHLFSEGFLNNSLQKNQIDIYFARANILHKERKYDQSSKYLQLANKKKLDLKISNAETLINKSKALLIQSDKKGVKQKEQIKLPQSIFIVGMPRSGSTLVESILSINSYVKDLGEINILEESYIEWTQDNPNLTLAEVYFKKLANHKNEYKIITNKWLYNYQYAGIIANHIPDSILIHCYRNPLDNILSMYRTYFDSGNEYSSSLIDCAKVYLNQEQLMNNYKNRFQSKIYSINYDSLVSSPNNEIKSLISWLGWEWDDSYLSPHLNPRSVMTASNIQVRSPINSKSIGGWKKYREMLKPAIEILTESDRYPDISSENKLTKPGKL